MKTLLTALILGLLSTIAQATDYNIGQCPAAQQGTLTNCNFLSAGPTDSPFSDTVTFLLGNWTESNGVLAYTSSQAITVMDGSLHVGGGRGGAIHVYYYTIIDSAEVDGVPMNPPPVGATGAAAHTWTLPGSLAAGSHVISVTGHRISLAEWLDPGWHAAVLGIQYTLEPMPAPAPSTVREE